MNIQSDVQCRFSRLFNEWPSKSCNLPTWEEAYKMFLQGGDN